MLAVTKMFFKEVSHDFMLLILTFIQVHFAAANGYAELLRYFLTYNPIAVNAQDKDGWTPLHASACWCQVSVLARRRFLFLAARQSIAMF